MKRQLFTGLALTIMACSAPALAASQGVSDQARLGLNLTLYANGLALIDDQRRVVLEKGINTLNISGISPAMLEDSARIDTGGKLNLHEQSFLKPNLSHQDLLKAYVGRSVKVIRTNPKTGEETVLDADVLSVNQGLILRIGGRIETTVPGRIVFADIPEGFRPQPVFRVTGQSPEIHESDLDLSYLSTGFSWRANHTLSVEAASPTIRLESRAILVNRSGLDINAATVQVVAGDVQRRTPSVPRPETTALRMMKTEGAAMMADAAAPPQRQSLGGYHLYTLNGKIDLADQTSKQVTLLAPVSLPVTRRLISETHANPFSPRQGTPRPTHPAIRLSVSNDKTTGPGQPIPGGIARMYGKDAEGRAQFLGEDHLNDLPVGATATISAGRAFDVTVTRHQTDYQREGLGRNTFEMAYRINITNGGERAETVQVIEAMGGGWNILEESAQHVRDNNRARWSINVPAKGDAEVTYRVRVKR